MPRIKWLKSNAEAAGVQASFIAADAFLTWASNCGDATVMCPSDVEALKIAISDHAGRVLMGLFRERREEERAEDPDGIEALSTMTAGDLEELFLVWVATFPAGRDRMEPETGWTTQDLVAFLAWALDRPEQAS